MAHDTLKRPKASLEERGLVRLTLDIPVEDANMLEELAGSTGYNKTTTVLRAIRVLSELVGEEREGAKIIVTHDDGSRERLRFV